MPLTSIWQLSLHCVIHIRWVYEKKSVPSVPVQLLILQRIVNENPSLEKYRHQSAKVQALGPLVYEDGETFVKEQAINPSTTMPLVNFSHPLEAPKCDLV